MSFGSGGESAAPAYVARFHRAVAIALVCSGLLLPISLICAVAVNGAHSLVAGLLGSLLLGPALVGAGALRISRGRRSGWTGLSIDSDGIFFGASPVNEPKRFPWDEISALVLFSRRTFFFQGAIRCIGIRAHPVSADSPETFRRTLDQEMKNQDLEEGERAALYRYRNDLSEIDWDIAVGFHTEARGWGYRRGRVRAAMSAHAPGVPIIEADAADYHDLVGWRAFQQSARELLEGAELRHWR